MFAWLLECRPHGSGPSATAIPRALRRERFARSAPGPRTRNPGGQPEIGFKAHFLTCSIPGAKHRSHHNDEKAHKQEVYTCALEFWLVARNSRRDKKGPVASHAVAIQKIANCVCHVRVTE